MKLNSPNHPLNEAPFLVIQFLHYANAVDMEKLSPSERTIILLYYVQLAELLAVVKTKHGYTKFNF